MRAKHILAGIFIGFLAGCAEIAMLHIGTFDRDSKFVVAAEPTVTNIGNGKRRFASDVSNGSNRGICLLLNADESSRPFSHFRVEDGARISKYDDEIDRGLPDFFPLYYVAPGETYRVHATSDFSKLTVVRIQGESMGKRVSRQDEAYYVTAGFIALFCNPAENGTEYDFNSHARKTFLIYTSPSKKFSF